MNKHVISIYSKPKIIKHFNELGVYISNIPKSTCYILFCDRRSNEFVCILYILLLQL